MTTRADQRRRSSVSMGTQSKVVKAHRVTGKEVMDQRDHGDIAAHTAVRTTRMRRKSFLAIEEIASGKKDEGDVKTSSLKGRTNISSDRWDMGDRGKGGRGGRSRRGSTSLQEMPTADSLSLDESIQSKRRQTLQTLDAVKELKEARRMSGAGRSGDLLEGAFYAGADHTTSADYSSGLFPNGLKEGMEGTNWVHKVFSARDQTELARGVAEDPIASSQALRAAAAGAGGGGGRGRARSFTGSVGAGVGGVGGGGGGGGNGDGGDDPLAEAPLAGIGGGDARRREAAARRSSGVGLRGGTAGGLALASGDVAAMKEKQKEARRVARRKSLNVGFKDPSAGQGGPAPAKARRKSSKLGARPPPDAILEGGAASGVDEEDDEDGAVDNASNDGPNGDDDSGGGNDDGGVGGGGGRRSSRRRRGDGDQEEKGEAVPIDGEGRGQHFGSDDLANEGGHGDVVDGYDDVDARGGGGDARRPPPLWLRILSCGAAQRRYQYEGETPAERRARKKKEVKRKRRKKEKRRSVKP